MKTLVLTYPLLRTLLTDLVIFILVYSIPAFAHITPIPMYLIEPMRIIMLVGYFLSTNRINKYFLAFTIPLFSTLTMGHPVLFKSFLIGFELATTIFLLDILLKQWKRYLLPVLIVSIILSKFFYYFLKYLFIGVGLLEGKLVSTPILAQVYAALGISIFYYLVICITNKYTRK